MLLGYHNLTINYFADNLLCRLHNMRNRLDITDIRTITLWFTIWTISVILSIFIHKCVIMIYIISIVILFTEFIKFREKNIIKSVNNIVEVIQYDTDDSKNFHVFVGRWCGKRPHMEDEHIISMSTNIFGVLDGHGGSTASRYIKHKFTSAYEEIFHNLLMNNNYSSIDLLTTDALEQTFMQMDQDLYDQSIDSGAVGVVIKINSDKIYCTCVGDSGAFVVMKNGMVKKLSTTHTLSNYSEYTRYQDIVFPLKPKIGCVLRTHSGLMPSRTIGDHSYKSRDIGLSNIPETTITIPCWKILILASDGIWDCVEPNEIRDSVQIIMDNHKKKNESDADLYKNMTKFMEEIHSMTVREVDLMDKLMCRYYGDNCTLMVIINKE